MVAQHYRWDFIGLSTDTKPTPESNTKVTDGSTYYCSDTSKLYVWCYDNWYERKPLGGGGGSDINVVQTTGTSTTDVMSQNAVTEALASAGGPTVVQTAGTSTTDVMSQNATTSMVFADPSTQRRIKIGSGTSANIGDESIEIGRNATATNSASIALGSSATASNTASIALGSSSNANNSNSVAIGAGSSVTGEHAVAVGYVSTVNGDKAVGLGRGANASKQFSVALGAGATTTAQGEINVSTGSTYPTRGYNNTNYRLISGVHDPVNAHDAATKGYVDAQAGGVTLYINTDLDDVLANGSGNIHIYSDSSLTLADQIDNEQLGAYVAAGESINFKYGDDLFKVIHIYYDGSVGSVSFIGGGSSKLTHAIDINFDGSMTGIKTFSAEAMEFQFN